MRHNRVRTNARSWEWRTAGRVGDIFVCIARGSYFLFGGCGCVKEKLARWIYMFLRIHFSPSFSFDFVSIVFLFCFISMFEVGLGGEWILDGTNGVLR